MAFSLRRLRAPHLLLAWIAYWVVLAAVTLRPALSAMLRVMSAPGEKGSATLSMGEGLVTATVSSATEQYVGSISILALALWLAGPPLLMWGVWLASRGRPERLDHVARDRPLPSGHSSPDSPAGFAARTPAKDRPPA